MNILYLEDNQDDAMLTRRWLKKTNPDYNIENVFTVKDALERLNNPPTAYDIVLTDLNLPDGYGLTVLNHIRTNKLPYAVVVVTGHSDEEVAIAALKSGADDYITKKEGYLDRLAGTLESALSRYKEEVALQSRSLRVLYAENNELDIDLTRRHIEKHAAHIRIEFVSLAEQLLSRLADPNIKERYDVVLMDYLLPGLNALEVLKEIFEDRKLDIPVILVTGHGSEEILIQAKKLGAADSVIKTPGYLYKLPAVIENAFHLAELARKLEELRAAEERWRILIQQSPAAIYVDAYDDFSSTIFISDQIVAICGYTPAEWMSDPQCWVDAIHPEDREKVLLENKRCNQFLLPFKMEYRLLRKNGGVAWVRDESYLIYDGSGKPNHWQGILVDISDQKQAEAALRRRDAIMEAISDASATFLVAPWFENIKTVLKNMGVAAGVSRAYIFQVHTTEEKRTIGKLAHEWIADGVPSFFGSAELEAFDFEQTGLGHWPEMMKEGRPIYGLVKNFSPAEQEVFSRQLVVSIVCVPIFVQKEWWGFIGFDECDEEREWLAPEIEALRVSAGILGAAVQRLAAERALQRQLKELTVLQAITAAGTESTSVDELIIKAIETLGDNLYQQNCGLLIYDQKLGGLRHHPSYRGLVEEEKSLVLPVDVGITGRVYRTGKAENVPDVLADPDYFCARENIRSEMCAPIKVGNNVFGVINVENTESNSYSKDDLRLLTTIASQLSTAVEKLQLFESERRRRQESETLRQAASVISTSLDLPTVLDTILISVGRVVPFDSAAIFLAEPDSQIIKIVGAMGFSTNLIGQVFSEPSTLLQEVRNSRQPLIVDDIKNDSRFAHWEHTSQEIENMHSWMGVPLIARDEVIGFLTLDNKNIGAYTYAHALITETLAFNASVAINNATLHERTVRQLNHLIALRKVDEAISSNRNMLDTLSVILEQVIAQLKVDAANILLYNPESKMLESVCSSGLQDATFLENDVHIGWPLAGIVAAEKKMLVYPDLGKAKSIPACFKEAGIAGYFGAPLNVKEQVKGVLEVFTRQEFTPAVEWLDFFITLAGQTAIAIENSQLFENLQLTNRELENAYDTTLEGWGRALELRDQETQGHSSRVTEITLKLAHAMGIDEEGLIHVKRGAWLHDIGKMGVPDDILHKPGKLTPEEWEKMRKHVDYSHELLSPIKYLERAMEIPYCHHEKWDGTGYPRGLKGEDIPLSARIFAVVDVWDALLSVRPYKPAWPLEKVVEELQNQKGKHFDPAVIDKFLELLDKGEIGYEPHEV